ADTIGGTASITAIFAILGGILTAIILPMLLRVLRVQHPSATGLSAGTAGAGIAAASVVPAAFAGIAVGVNGLITALLAPLLVRLFQHL
ncbi:MAG: LrgB family protein, partial [Terriglobus sp.]